MATPTDTRVRPILDIIEDSSLALKWANSALVIRILSQIATGFMWGATSDSFRDVETGEKLMNVAPETSKFYSNLALLNAFGLPFDVTYTTFLNAAEGGNTKAIAQDSIT